MRTKCTRNLHFIYLLFSICTSVHWWYLFFSINNRYHPKQYKVVTTHNKKQKKYKSKHLQITMDNQFSFPFTSLELALIEVSSSAESEQRLMETLTLLKVGSINDDVFTLLVRLKLGTVVLTKPLAYHVAELLSDILLSTIPASKAVRVHSFSGNSRLRISCLLIKQPHGQTRGKLDWQISDPDTN